MAAATTQGLAPLECTVGTVVVVSVVDDGVAVVVVVVVVVGAGADDAEKATTWSADGATSRPAPKDGVGK
jgi:hypothetical protein